MLTKKITHISISNFSHLWLIPLVTSATIMIWICHHCRPPLPLHPMKSLLPPLPVISILKNGTFSMHLWLLGHSLGSRLGLRLAALPPRPTAGRRSRRRRIRGGGDEEPPLPPRGQQRQQWMGGRQQRGRDGGADPEGVARPIPLRAHVHDDTHPRRPPPPGRRRQQVEGGGEQTDKR
jgi:hypothetical protein